jgi:hypothetical protein
VARVVGGFVVGGRGVVVGVLGVLLGVLVFVGLAWGVGVSGAVWGVAVVAYPSDFTVADNAACLVEVQSLAYLRCDTWVVTGTDVGSLATNGGAVTLTDTLPAGVSVRDVALFWSGLTGVAGHNELEDLVEKGYAKCTIVLPLVRCVVPTAFFTELPAPGREVHPDDTLKLYVSVTVNEPVVAGELADSGSVSGAGAGEAAASAVNTLESGPAVFGFSEFRAPLLGVDGAADSVAGAHPYELGSRIALNSVVREDPESIVRATTVRDPRDVIVDLPPGVAGSAVSAPQCTLARLSSKGPKEEQGVSGCPKDTIIGHIRTFPESNIAADVPLYNLVPERGVAAEIGFIDGTGGSHVLYVSLAPTTAGYVLRTAAHEIPQFNVTEIITNVYGDPAARDRVIEKGGSYATVAGDVPTFTNPEDCSGEPLQTTVLMDSWQAPGSYNADGTPNLADPNWVSSTSQSPPVTGCSELQGLFNPVLTASTETTRADSPTGLNVSVNVPQQEGAEVPGTPPLRDTTIVLPEGLSVNPSSANGLQACSLTQIGMSAGGVPDAAAPACPSASRIGTVELEAPALPAQACKQTNVPVQECPAGETEKTPLLGSIYVAKQSENPFGSLLAIYIVIDDPRTGVIVKLPAEVKANPATGQLTSTVNDTPQFPFSTLRTHFFGGSTASLSTPASCGTYTVSSQLTPWSAPESGPPATPASAFQITQNAAGAGCAAPGFAPVLTAGSTTTHADSYTPLSVTFSRQDTEQTLSAVNVTTAPGLLGIIKNIPKCPEPQASRGECSPESLLGESTSAVGAGPDPYWVHGGQVYLTGPYNGGPFGLSVVVPTTAGPYTLTGNGGPGREIVRASIRIDPHTAQITVASDPLPTILEGIPLQIKAVNVTINRPAFTFTPTNCSPLSITAAFTSSTGATANASNPYYASSCATLPFKPVLSASTNGHASKRNGASLTVKMTAKGGPQPGGGEANIRTVKVELPKQLPSRQSTLAKACLAKTFETNPAACPHESNVGTATTTTPTLAHPLTGPAYLVSYGATKFPNLEIVLQGEGITLILDGTTHITKGITSTTFQTVPDAPITTFELNLPTGQYSALTAYVPEKDKYNLCPQTLTMPTTITAQNNTTITQTTKITTTNCHKTKHTNKHKKHTKHKH